MNREVTRLEPAVSWRPPQGLCVSQAEGLEVGWPVDTLAWGRVAW